MHFSSPESYPITSPTQARKIIICSFSHPQRSLPPPPSPSPPFQNPQPIYNINAHTAAAPSTAAPATLPPPAAAPGNVPTVALGVGLATTTVPFDAPDPPPAPPVGTTWPDAVAPPCTTVVVVAVSVAAPAVDDESVAVAMETVAEPLEGMGKGALPLPG